MATIRHHAHIDRPADEVWNVVKDAGNIHAWFPGFEASRSDGTTRTVTMTGAGDIEESIVTSDDDLRRFQYRITGGVMPVESHLGTIDVFEDGDGALVVYSTEVEPDSLKKAMDPAIEGAVGGLKEYCER